MMYTNTSFEWYMDYGVHSFISILVQWIVRNCLIGNMIRLIRFIQICTNKTPIHLAAVPSSYRSYIMILHESICSAALSSSTPSTNAKWRHTLRGSSQTKTLDYVLCLPSAFHLQCVYVPIFLIQRFWKHVENPSF